MLSQEIYRSLTEDINKSPCSTMLELSHYITSICDNNKVVLLIDEVDQASNYEVFIKFLSMLRSKYLKRSREATFYSVILAGIYDIKNLKVKISNDKSQQFNSPWNIAEDFNIDMSFSSEEISTMLLEYKREQHLIFDIKTISQIIFEYTSGYSYLVSLICKTIDEKLNKDFTIEGVKKAINKVLKEDNNNSLFDDMIKNIQKYNELSTLIQNILFNDEEYIFHSKNFIINLGYTLGFIDNDNDKVIIANRIFETYLYNYFISLESTNKTIYIKSKENKNQFIINNNLDMNKVIKKFVEYFNDIYNTNDQEFIEEQGRKIFLMYLKPIINGIGNYYIEARTRDNTRTDIIVDYLGKQYIIELKIRKGNNYNKNGEKQLIEYLDLYHADHGYLVSFCFNKNKKIGVQEKKIADKIIFEAIV